MYPVGLCRECEDVGFVVRGSQVESVALVAAAGVVVIDVGGEYGARRWCSPVMRSRSVHSRRTEAIQRSAKAFIRGACGAVRTISIPIEVNTASNAAVNFASRSRMR